MSVGEAVAALAATIRLEHFATFSLYEALRPLAPSRGGPEAALPEEHLLLDEHRCAAAVPGTGCLPLCQVEGDLCVGSPGLTAESRRPASPPCITRPCDVQVPGGRGV
jgi:hypothetical protein